MTPTAALMLEAWMDLWLACWGWEKRREREWQAKEYSPREKGGLPQ
jgi:hypothetical protein